MADKSKSSVRAWAMYDFATQGYQVTTASALLPAFFVIAIAPEGATIFGIHIPADGLWGFSASLAAAVVFIIAPCLGAIADYSYFKKKFLMSFAFCGSLFASLLFFATTGEAWLALLCYVIAQVCYTSGNVFYDAFLPQISTDQTFDQNSGTGFAFGYAGGTLQFGFALALVAGHRWIGIEQELATRLALLSAGLWWFVFSLYTFWKLEEEKPRNFEVGTRLKDIPILVHQGLKRTKETILQLPKFPMMLLFLIAYFFYNDGIQTIINVAAVYGGGTLQLSTEVIMVTFLTVQFIAIFGALLFSKLSVRFGTKKTLMGALVCWCVVIIIAYFLKAERPFSFIMVGALIGLILGGSQALSRSLYASIIPPDAPAGLFGFYSIFSKLSAIVGPFLFGLLTTVFSDARPAVLTIILFFILGTVLLYFVDIEQARSRRGDWKLTRD